MAKIPLPLTTADRDGGFWRELSMRQVETSRTLVFDNGVHARAFFEALLCENMDLGRPENAGLLFRRGQRRGSASNPPPGGVQDQDRPVLQPGHHERLLQELPPQAVPQGRRSRCASRLSSTAPRTCAGNRRLENLPELQDKARAINDRLLHTETASQGTVLASPVIERITRPTVTGDGRKAPALRSGDLRVQALAGAIAAMLFTVPGITNKTLRGLMTGQLHRPCSMNQASYDLARLARNDLIQKDPRPQPLHPDQRRAPVRLLLHQGLRPRPAPAHGTGPAQRATRARRGPGHPRPAHRQPHRQGPRPTAACAQSPPAPANAAGHRMPATSRHHITHRDTQD